MWDFGLVCLALWKWKCTEEQAFKMCHGHWICRHTAYTLHDLAFCFSLCLLSSVRIYQLFWCPYFVRIQIRPSVSTVTIEQVVRPLPHTWWAVQPIGSSAWQACSNTNDAVTCLAFPPRCSGSGYAKVSQGFVFSGGKFVGSVGTLSAKTPDWPLNTGHYSWHFTPYIKATPQYKSAVLYTTH